ncbi:membrane-bound acid phosphatase 2 [Trypanosoma vivax]|nr:membrane-bound acid phosphatase 2 [Trypanosoma vivax]
MGAIELHSVQVIHRHGSRSAIVSYNESQICADTPCGHLNVPGQTMMTKAGEFLRSQYNANTLGPLFPSESYDLGVSYTRSTDVLRTIQSAECLLRGLFPNSTAFLPVVHTVDSATDWLLTSTNVPYSYAFYDADLDWWHNVCNPALDALIDFGTLISIAKEAFSEGFCAEPHHRCKCALMLFDIGAALSANGQIGNFPALQKHLQKLRSVAYLSFKEQFGYNASQEVHVHMGSQGQFLAQKIIDNFENHILGASSFKLYHYSAHDTTLSPLSATLGDATLTGMLPPFGQLYSVELLYDTSAKNYSVRVRRGAPGQTSESGYLFAWDEFQLRCMDSTNKIYDAVENICPFSDFKRFIDSTKGTDPAGPCYLSDRHKKLLNCSAEKSSHRKACESYRKVCPKWACSPDFAVDASSSECVCVSLSCMELAEGGDNTRASVISLNKVFIIVSVTFIVGIVSSAVVFYLFISSKGSKREHTILAMETM